MLNRYSIYNYIGIILFKLLLDYLYISFISKLFEYMGFGLDINIEKYLIGWVMFIFTYYILTLKEKTALYPILLLSFLILITPSSTLFGLKNESYLSFILISGSFLILVFTITVKKIKLKKVKINRNIVIGLIIAIVCIVLFHYISVNGLQNLTLDFTKVYELRRELGDSQNTGLFGYLNNWTIKFFNIFLIIYYAKKRNFLMSVFFIFIQILLFSLSGHKSVIVALLLIGLIYQIYKYKNLNPILIYSMVAFLLFNILYTLYTKDIFLSSILIRRAFFIPADLNFLHIEFFSTHKPLYWSNSILKYFIDYPYDMPATHIVANYIGEPDAAANTGFIGSGYMHFPFIGNLLYIIILSFIINISNALNGYPKWFLNAVFSMPLLTAMISADLMIALLTHGLLITFVFMYLTQEREHQ
jgi:hypothetical protein